MTEIINALHNDQPTESTHEVMQHRPLPSRFDLRAAKAMNRSKNHKPRAAAVVSAAAAAVLTLSAIAPTPEATLALWNDTLSIYLGVNPDVWIPPTVTEVPPPSVPQDGDRCFYFDDFNSNGIRRPEVKFAFGTPTPGTENTGGDLSKLFESNPSITISYSTTVRNFTNRGGTTANPAPAILFQSVRASAASLATVGTATPSTSTLAGAGIFHISSPVIPAGQPGWFYSTVPSGSTVTGNNTGNEPEFVNVGDISTGSISLGTIDKSNAQIYMYAQDRMGTTGTFSGYIAPSSFSFTLTGPATQNLIDYLAYSAESAADFAAQGITVSNGILTWDGTRTTPGFFDNNGDADTPLWGNGLACEAFGLTGSNAYTAPFRVRDLAGTRAGNTVSLSWTAPRENGGTAITGYEFYYTTSNVWVQGASNSAFDNATRISAAEFMSRTLTPAVTRTGTDTTYTITLPSNASYYIWVRAVNNAPHPAGAPGKGVWTRVNIGSVAAAPTISSATRNGSQVTLNWNNITNSTGYDIYWTTSNSTTPPADTITLTTSGANQNAVTNQAGGTASTRTYTINPGTASALSPGTTYYFWIRTRTGSGNNVVYGPWSSAPFRVGMPAAAPTSLARVSRFASEATLSWTGVAAANNGGSAITGYQLAWATGTSVPSTLDASNSVEVTASPATATGLTATTAYNFWVRAKNANGYGPWTAVLNIGGVPAQPTGLNVNRTNNQATSVTMYWTAPTNTGGSAITGWQIYRTTTSARPALNTAINATGSTERTTLAAPTQNQTQSVSGLTAGQQYYWWVRARNANGYGDWQASSLQRAMISPIMSGQAPEIVTELLEAEGFIVAPQWVDPDGNVIDADSALAAQVIPTATDVDETHDEFVVSEIWYYYDEYNENLFDQYKRLGAKLQLVVVPVEIETDTNENDDIVLDDETDPSDGPQEWVAGTQFQVGDLVVFNGRMFQSWQDQQSTGEWNQPGVLTGPWMEFGDPVKAPDGRTVLTWTPTWIYATGDVVAHDGLFFQVVSGQNHVRGGGWNTPGYSVHNPWEVINFGNHAPANAPVSAEPEVSSDYHELVVDNYEVYMSEAVDVYVPEIVEYVGADYPAYEPVAKPEYTTYALVKVGGYEPDPNPEDYS